VRGGACVKIPNLLSSTDEFSVFADLSGEGNLKATQKKEKKGTLRHGGRGPQVGEETEEKADRKRRGETKNKGCQLRSSQEKVRGLHQSQIEE